MNEAQNSEFVPGTNFLICLTEYEIRQGLVVIGHRFEPFCHPGLSPGKIEAEDASGKRLGSRITGISFSSATKYFRLFGHHGMIDRFVKEDGANLRALQLPGDPKDLIIRMRVFECSSLLRDAKLEPGDYLLATIMDVERERFRLLPLPARDIDAGVKSAWKSELGAAFAHVLASSLPSADAFQLVRAAYLCADPSVLAKPGGAYSDFFNEGGILEFKTWQSLEILWKSGTTDKEIDTLMIRSLSESGVYPEDDFSSDARELELSVDAGDLEAFILDGLWKRLSGSTAIRYSLDRVLVDVDKLGVTKSSIASLRKSGREVGKEIIESIDMSAFMRMTDSNMRRSELLSIYGRLLAWMRSFGEAAASDSRSEKIVMEALRTMGPLVNTIYRLNLTELKDQDADPNPDDLYRDMRDQAEAAISSLESLRPHSSGVRRDSRSDGSGLQESLEMRGYSRPRNLFGLEIVIDETRPPVYRTLSIPGNRTLSDLHDCIQDAFGWTNSHLHEFEIGDAHYGEPSDEDYVPLISDDTVSLDELGLRKGADFIYTYDFGDEWKHLVKVREKRHLSAAEAWEMLPSCTGGARAAPPEDCGGIYGYQDLLECIATPAATRSEQQREFIAWKGRWTPDRFNMSAVNKKLAKR